MSENWDKELKIKEEIKIFEWEVKKVKLEVKLPSQQDRRWFFVPPLDDAEDGGWPEMFTKQNFKTVKGWKPKFKLCGFSRNVGPTNSQYQTY